MRTVTLALLLAFPAAAFAQDAERGKVIYAKRCSQCHGDDGAADGPGANFMRPRPRVFKENVAYKFRTTPSGTLPTRQDLFNIITRGIPGTSMPNFAVLTEQERWDLVLFIETLTPEFSQEDAIAEAVVLEELAGAKAPGSSAESIQRGREVYVSNKCQQCHGDQGRGNGPSWPDMKDDWKNPILPANLANKEAFRGGAEPFDVFRTLSAGLNGTPMPAFRDSISVEQRWDLVNYILSLGPPLKRQRDEVIEAKRVSELTDDPSAEVWKDVVPARFETVPNIIEPPRLFWTTVEFISVQALYTNDEVAIRIQWDDRSQSKGTNLTTRYDDRDTKIYLKTDHPDQLALQFPSKVDPTTRPYFIFGDAKRPVNLWHWRSDLNTLVEKNAKGSGTMSEQPEKSQNLVGKVVFDDGRYTAVFRRSLTTQDTKKDVQFAPGEFVPIAFHVWDGQSGELGNRHGLTTWYWLYLKPEAPSNAVALAGVAFVVSAALLALAFKLIRARAERQAAAATRPAPGYGSLA
jgi:DMSO reductase family type II enzyme heme b subunit